jgi:hypothetical protein
MKINENVEILVGINIGKKGHISKIYSPLTLDKESIYHIVFNGGNSGHYKISEIRSVTNG